MPAGFQCHVIETEFWGQMAKPNLMVEVCADDLADLVSALALHVGEVKRNAYHLRLPAWMMDNVRRAEAVGGPGSVAPDFTFATNYRIRKWQGGRLKGIRAESRFLSRKMEPGPLLSHEP
jgi:N-acetylglucosamine malate deacetylase 1